MFLPVFLVLFFVFLAPAIPLHIWGAKKMAKKQPWDGTKGFSMIPSEICYLFAAISFACFIHWSLGFILFGAIVLVLWMAATGRID